MRSLRPKLVGLVATGMAWASLLTWLAAGEGQAPAAGAAPAGKSARKKWARPAPIKGQAHLRLAKKAKGDFANPKEFPLQNVYELSLAAVAVLTPNGPDVGAPAEFHLLGYNGKRVGQTIRVRRGSTLRVRLKNDLKGGGAGPGDVGSAAPPNDRAEGPRNLDETNLHTHGLHVSPADPGDNVLLCVKPGQPRDFVFQIPPDHPAGTFWYHPHNHASVAYQLSNGVAGALIVEGTPNDGIHDLDDLPEIAAAAEKILVLQLYNFRSRVDANGNVGPGAVGWIDATTIYNVEVASSRVADVQVAKQDEGPVGTDTFQATAINGRLNPTIHIAPGEVQRWRLIHAGWDLDRQLIFVDDNDLPTSDLTFHEIALDGLATGRIENKTMVEIAPGQRSDALVKAPNLPADTPERVYHLKQVGVDGINAPHGAPQDPMFLARIVVSGRPRRMRLPDPKEVARCRPLPAIRHAELSKTRRTFTFAATDVTPPHYTINDAVFHKQDPIPLVVNTAEEWTIEAAELSHPFHIHVNPFQIVRYIDPDGRSTPMDVWRDTLYIKQGERYVIRSRFLDYPGLSVLHCHILDHEDQGMMLPLKFSHPGQPPPAQEICPNLQPPATKLQAAATPAPPLRLTEAGGAIRDLAAYRGRRVALVFIQGIECIHCGERLADLVREARGRLGAGAAIVAVSGRPIRDPAEALGRLGVVGSDRFSLLVDESHRGFRDFGCYRDGPRHGLFLIDGEGVIRARYVGDVPYGDSKEVIERLNGLEATTWGGVRE